MGERGVRNAEVEGSNPLPSTMNIVARRKVGEDQGALAVVVDEPADRLMDLFNEAPGLSHRDLRGHSDQLGDDPLTAVQEDPEVVPVGVDRADVGDGALVPERVQRAPDPRRADSEAIVEPRVGLQFAKVLVDVRLHLVRAGLQVLPDASEDRPRSGRTSTGDRGQVAEAGYVDTVSHPRVS